MRLTLLGTGAPGGVPLYGCRCSACEKGRRDSAAVRRPACALIEIGTKRYLIDAGLPELAERFAQTGLDAIFLTHFHPDHVQGLFPLRWGKGAPLTVYCPPDRQGCADLYKHPGLLEFRPVSALATWSCGAMTVTALPLQHSKPTHGYLFSGRRMTVVYLTDTKGLEQTVVERLQAVSIDLLILDACTPTEAPHPNHNSLGEALDLAALVAPRKTILTHIGHDLDDQLLRNSTALPPQVDIGRDGDTFDI